MAGDSLLLEVGRTSSAEDISETVLSEDVGRLSRCLVGMGPVLGASASSGASTKQPVIMFATDGLLAMVACTLNTLTPHTLAAQ